MVVLAKDDIVHTSVHLDVIATFFSYTFSKSDSETKICVQVIYSGGKFRRGLWKWERKEKAANTAALMSSDKNKRITHIPLHPVIALQSDRSAIIVGHLPLHHGISDNGKKEYLGDTETILLTPK